MACPIDIRGGHIDTETFIGTTAVHRSLYTHTHTAPYSPLPSQLTVLHIIDKIGWMRFTCITKVAFTLV